jgi:hypothetical protein
MLKYIIFSVLKCNCYTWIQIEQLKLMRILVLSLAGFSLISNSRKEQILFGYTAHFSVAVLYCPHFVSCLDCGPCHSCGCVLGGGGVYCMPKYFSPFLSIVLYCLRSKYFKFCRKQFINSQ